MILERSLLRDKAEGSAAYLKYHLLQNGRKIIGKFNTNFPTQVLTLLPTAFYDFLSYEGGFLSHTPENNVNII